MHFCRYLLPNVNKPLTASLIPWESKKYRTWKSPLPINHTTSGSRKWEKINCYFSLAIFLWKMSSLLQLNGNKVFYKQVNQSNHVTKRVTVVTLWSPAKKDRPIALRLFNRKEEVIKQVIPKTLAFLQKNEQTLRYYDVIINAKERSFMYSRLHKVGSIKEWLISKLVNYVWIMHFSKTYPLLRGFLDHSPMLDSRELR